MTHLIDKIEQRPYLCEDCKHFIKGLQCRAFDIIPLEVFEDPEGHTSVLPGQKGDYVFETDKPRDTIRIYVDEDEVPED